jgi:hypothetical protein
MIRRSPNLTPDRIAVIEAIVRGWDGRLTWPALIQAISKKMHATYTRQALYQQERIRIAYEVHRSRTQDKGVGRPMSPALKACADRIERLERENDELHKRESLLLEQFIRWQYNAAARGLSEEVLNGALPAVNRRGNRRSGFGSPNLKSAIRERSR